MCFLLKSPGGPSGFESNKLAADQFKPLDVPKDQQAHDATVENMAHRIVSTYLQSNHAERDMGEKFYSQDAHGAARALNLGVDPNSSVGHMMRTTPSPREQSAAWRGGKDISLPSTASTNSPANESIRQGVRRGAGTLARLSPQTGWEDNVKQAHEAYSLPDETVHDLMNDKRGGLKGKVLNRQPSANVVHAAKIAKGQETPEQNIATGSKRVKIGSFFENIADPDTSKATTVDFRAHDISAGQLLPTGTNRGMSSKKRYDMFEQAHDRAADILNKEHPTERNQAAPLQSKQVQATAWWTDKRNVEDRLGGAHQKGAHLHANNGKILTRGHLGTPAGQ